MFKRSVNNKRRVKTVKNVKEDGHPEKAGVTGFHIHRIQMVQMKMLLYQLVF